MLKRFFTFLIIVLLIQAAPAQLKSGDHALTFISSFDQTKQPYRLYVPEQAEEGKTVPLLVVLHGKWVDQNAWFDYTPVKEFGRNNGFLIAAPYGRGDYFYRGPGEQDVLDIIETVLYKFNVDENRIYLMGHSMGGWGSWWIGLRNRDLFACISPMSGFPPMEFLPNALHLDPYVIHSEDDPVVAVSGSREPMARLGEIGISHRYLEENGYGHSSKMIGDNLSNLFRWMKQHERPKNPQKINIIIRTPAKGSAWWLRITDTLKYPEIASVSAEINEEGVISIVTGNVKEIAIEQELLPDNIIPKEIRIDGSIIEIREPEAWGILSYHDDQWNYKRLMVEPLPYKSPVVEKISKDADIATSSMLLTDMAAQHLCDAMKVDLCLFLDDMFQFPGGELTEDGVLDLYVYPEERMAIFEYTGADLPKYLNMESRFYPLGKYNPKLRKVWKVAAPWILARRISRNPDLQQKKIWEFLLESVKDKEKFILK